MGGYAVASNYPCAMAKCEINASISYSKDMVKQPVLNLERAANLKVNTVSFMEVFFIETKADGSPPAQGAYKMLQYPCI